MTDEMVADINNAIARLRNAFLKHGLSEPSAIVLADERDFTVLRHSPPPMAAYHSPDVLADHVACRIGGMPLIKPSE